MKNNTLILFMALSMTTALSAAALPEVAVPAADASAFTAGDVSSELVSLFQAGDELSEKEVSELQRLYVIFVPGFLSNVVTEPSQVIEQDKGLPKLSGYFSQQVVFLRSLGVQCGIADIESQSSTEQNARTLRKIIRSSEKKVLLIAHSKGGLDSLEALLEEPGLRANVAGVITIQSPFFGSPVADLVLSNSVTSYPSQKLLAALGGTKQSLVDLSSSIRKDYQAKNRAGIEKLTAGVPFLCVTTYKQRGLIPYDTLLEVFRDYMLLLGLQNDGMVPAQRGMLPGSRYAVLGGVDHLATVMSVPVPSFDRVRFLKALLKLRLQNPPR